MSGSAGMAESLAVIKSLWSTGAATFEGEHYRITGAVGAPKPAPAAPSPDHHRGRRRRVLGIAAREADIVGVNPSLAAGYIGPEVLETTTAEYYDQRIEWIREAAGDRFDDLELQCLTFLVQIVPDREEAVARLAADAVGHDRAGRRVADRPDRVHRPDRRALRERRERFGFSYLVVHEAEMEAFAPVVAALSGT